MAEPTAKATVIGVPLSEATRAAIQRGLRRYADQEPDPED